LDRIEALVAREHDLRDTAVALSRRKKLIAAWPRFGALRVRIVFWIEGLAYARGDMARERIEQ
jgi:hypothetical protein